jgi:ABC-type antimicrobial peptide transport system permease subunit
VREFGVRAAVGAAPRQLIALIMRDALPLTAPGLAAGVILVVAFARLTKSFVYGLSPADPISMAAAAFLLLLASIAACCRPNAPRAVDPAAALRCE